MRLFYCRGQKFDTGICLYNKHIPVQMSTEIPSKFTMQVIRNHEKNSSHTDDVITVSREGQYFRVQYVGKMDKVKHVVSMTGGDLYKYFKNLMTMLANDDEPFTHVQFNFPVTPDVMYKTANLCAMTDVILDQFDSLISNWPINAYSSYE